MRVCCYKKGFYVVSKVKVFWLYWTVEATCGILWYHHQSKYRYPRGKTNMSLIFSHSIQWMLRCSAGWINVDLLVSLELKGALCRPAIKIVGRHRSERGYKNTPKALSVSRNSFWPQWVTRQVTEPQKSSEETREPAGRSTISAVLHQSGLYTRWDTTWSKSHVPAWNLPNGETESMRTIIL